MTERAVRRWWTGPAVLALALVATACGGGGGGGTVEVTLQEWAVAANPSTISAGEVTFEATNEGPNDPHELVVIRTDLAPDQLPTNPDGTVNEEGEGIEVLDEIEEFPVGETRSLTLDLEAGSYVLICNIYDEEEQEAHYQEGMRTGFTVE
ncbi:MAG: hypothetical protein KatS3mg014_2279 [Actinomycetota bacterium]|nr:MAG: hypothetical protein KatS3mg014_2279 [Actinomycetota bacterium]